MSLTKRDLQSIRGIIKDEVTTVVKEEVTIIVETIVETIVTEKVNAVEKRLMATFTSLQIYLDTKFRAIDDNFRIIENKFHEMDIRFDAMDKRFDKIEYIIEGHGERIKRLEETVHIS